MNTLSKSKKSSGFAGKAFSEIRHFRTYPHNMQVLLITNMLYAFVLPVVELFVGTYIIRNSSEMAYVIGYQLAVYSGIPLTFLVNGFLMKKIKITWLYAFGMLLSGISMAVMMSLETLDLGGIVMAGLIMGMSYGFFWANRDFLALNSTNDGNRNYYYGLESFFNTMASVIVPYVIGLFLGAAADKGILGGDIDLAYKIVTLCVFVLTIMASCVLSRGKFPKPENRKFIYFRFDKLWNRMMGLAGLKGIAQGYIVTAPSMLVMTFVGNESTLGVLQSISAIVSAVLLYILGRFTSPKHRIWIFSAGLLLFALGGAFNTVLYSATGVIAFMLCLVLARPLMDMGYFPIQMRVIDYVSRKEKRSSYTYIFVHELGLYIGRFFGCGLFIVITLLISDVVALRYTILIIGVIQLLSIAVALHITKYLDKAEQGVEPRAL
ncbi:MAG: MFS transporter [Bacteroidetes bacterium]|uniref:MFS transporter n=1 Tax=Candidatus Cryptobacteroides excrementipullorum TaxID=2840761 RepID=A0A9D9NLY2_9BACT|nr:MFS transporter [Candidatus Cryptobacteroides excrementipullorum]